MFKRCILVSSLSLLSLLSLLSPPASASPGMLDGNGWKQLNDAQKRIYLLGFSNACQEMDYFTKELFDRAKKQAKQQKYKMVQKTVEELDGQFFGLNRDFSTMAKTETGKLISELESFYRVKENGKLPVTFGIFFVSSKHRGIPEHQLRGMLEGMRQSIKK